MKIMVNSSDKSRYGTLWNREESILAFELYLQNSISKNESQQSSGERISDSLGAKFSVSREKARQFRCI